MTQSLDNSREIALHIIYGNNLLIAALFSFNDKNLPEASELAEEAQKQFSKARQLGCNNEGLEELVREANRGNVHSLVLRAKVDYHAGIKETSRAKEVLLEEAVKLYVEASREFDELHTYSLDRPELAEQRIIEENGILGPVDRLDYQVNSLQQIISNTVFPHLLDASLRLTKSWYSSGRTLLMGKSKVEVPTDNDLREGIEYFKKALPWCRSFLEFYKEAEEKG